MKKTSLNKSGFAVIEGVIVVVVLVVVIGVGFMVYKRSDNSTSKKLDSAEDVTTVEQDLSKQGDSLSSDLNADTAKLDEATKDVQ